MDRIRVAVVDDHAIVREGIRALLSGSPDIDVVGEAADGASAIELAARLAPDVLVMDIAMPGLGGLEAAAEIHRAQPGVRILVLSQYDNPEYVRRFLRLGAAGYVLKRAAGSDSGRRHPRRPPRRPRHRSGRRARGARRRGRIRGQCPPTRTRP